MKSKPGDAKIAITFRLSLELDKALELKALKTRKGKGKLIVAALEKALKRELEEVGEIA